MSNVTLMTDFGIRDYFVGAMKGVILSFNPNAVIVDITHEIAPQQIKSAAFTLVNYYKHFPPGTVHLAVVDPGVGSNRRAILAATEKYFFVAPDNGLLSFIFNEESNFRVFELTDPKYFLSNVSQTFHGRDVFAPVAAHLSKGVSPNDFGAEIFDFVRFELNAPQVISVTESVGEILHIDHFGNLITNFKTVNLPAEFKLEVNEKSTERHHKFYAEAERGEIFSIGGSAGFLEIAVFMGSAEKMMGAKVGQKVALKVIKNEIRGF